jgi:hypothetical protein
MSLLKSNSVQIGQSVTATNNFTLSVPSSPDGTIKLARGNSGATTADVLNVASDGRLSFNKPPIGSIIQVVGYSFTGSSSTTSGSYVDTFMSGAITPSSNTSKILVGISSQGLRSGTAIMSANIVRGSTQVCEWAYVQQSEWETFGFQYLDSPASSSSITYKVQMKAYSGSGTVYFGTGDPFVSTLILQEVCA